VVWNPKGNYGPICVLTYWSLITNSKAIRCTAILNTSYWTILHIPKDTCFYIKKFHKNFISQSSLMSTIVIYLQIHFFNRERPAHFHSLYKGARFRLKEYSLSATCVCDEISNGITSVRNNSCWLWTFSGSEGLDIGIVCVNISLHLCVQTGSGAHPASYTTGAGGSFPEGKARPGRDADHTPLSSAEVKKE
jgi:hypothetical protein